MYVRFISIFRNKYYKSMWGYNLQILEDHFVVLLSTPKFIYRSNTLTYKSHFFMIASHRLIRSLLNA